MNTPSAPDITPHLKSEERIAALTLVLGIVAGLPIAFFHGWRWGSGILVGAVLAWFNFRWLKQGLDALADASRAQAGQPHAVVPLGVYFRAAFRYLLIALAVYVIFEILHLPVASMVFGLCALGASTFLVSVVEILFPPD